MVVLILKIYVVMVVVIMALYAGRHYRFTMNRLVGRQRLYYQDIVDSDLPPDLGAGPDVRRGEGGAAIAGRPAALRLSA